MTDLYVISNTFVVTELHWISFLAPVSCVHMGFFTHLHAARVSIEWAHFQLYQVFLNFYSPTASLPHLVLLDCLISVSLMCVKWYLIVLLCMSLILVYWSLDFFSELLVHILCWVLAQAVISYVIWSKLPKFSVSVSSSAGWKVYNRITL